MSDLRKRKRAIAAQLTEQNSYTQNSGLRLDVMRALCRMRYDTLRNLQLLISIRDRQREIKAEDEAEAAENQEFDYIDFGCHTEEANQAVTNLLNDTVLRIELRTYRNREVIASTVKEILHMIGEGATDTTVKETFYQHLVPTLRAENIPLIQEDLYE